MLDLGFLKDITDLMKHIPFKRQTLFFSATITDKIRKLAYSIVKNPIRIQISPENPVNKNIDHSLAMIEMDDKRFFLERIVNENPESKFLIFVRTKVRAERVAKAMERVNIQTSTIHGDKDQKERIKVLDQFRNNTIKILIATDVSARGIDIADVDIVVNYDLPDQAESYVHRVGRTGRANKKGQAVSFCSKEEIPLLKEIETFIGSKIDLIKIKKDVYEETIQLKNDSKEYDWKSLISDD
jgi:ATP-dependent RNA helicase RhlE